MTDVGADFLRDVFPAGEDMARCLGSLTKLTRHLPEPVIVTGGMATSWHLLTNGRRRPMKCLSDIDVVVEGLQSLCPSLSEDFLVRHFHPSRGRGRILIQLVDEEHRLRVDVFTPAVSTLATRLTDLAVGGVPCKIVSIEDLAAKLLSVIYPVTDGEPVEAKHLAHFRLLLTIADAATAKRVWREYRKEGQHLEFRDAVKAVERSISEHPELLQPGHYSQDINQTCQWCRASRAFPLAPPSKVYDVLGYV